MICLLLMIIDSVPYFKIRLVLFGNDVLIENYERFFLWPELFCSKNDFENSTTSKMVFTKMSLHFTKNDKNVTSLHKNVTATFGQSYWTFNDPKLNSHDSITKQLNIQQTITPKSHKHQNRMRWSSNICAKNTNSIQPCKLNGFQLTRLLW